MAQILYWITHLSVAIDAIKSATQYLADTIEIFAALIIGVAALEALVRAARLFVLRTMPPGAKEDVRLRLGRWLAVALEFELGADILRTAVAPTLQVIGQLAAIAAIRTALNYFLQKEIEAAAARQAVAPTTALQVPRQQREEQAHVPGQAQEYTRDEVSPGSQGQTSDEQQAGEGKNGCAA